MFRVENQSEVFTPLIYGLSVIAIVFTSLIALMQEDMKKLIAYSSVAHMGFVTLGVFTIQQQGIEGSILQMISHGLNQVLSMDLRMMFLEMVNIFKIVIKISK